MAHGACLVSDADLEVDLCPWSLHSLPCRRHHPSVEVGYTAGDEDARSVILVRIYSNASFYLGHPMLLHLRSRLLTEDQRHPPQAQWYLEAWPLPRVCFVASKEKDLTILEDVQCSCNDLDRRQSVEGFSTKCGGGGR